MSIKPSGTVSISLSGHSTGMSPHPGNRSILTTYPFVSTGLGLGLIRRNWGWSESFSLDRHIAAGNLLGKGCTQANAAGDCLLFTGL